MADIKISALPPASTIDGTEVVPLNQAGVTSQTTVADILSGGLSGSGSAALIGTNDGWSNVQASLNARPQSIDSVADLQAATSSTLTAMASTISAFYGAAAGAMGGGDFYQLPSPVSANSVTIFNDASARSWQRGDITKINVRMAGAKGDGVTNDRVAIQAAIDYLASVGGGELYFPRGTYLVDAAGTNYAALWVSTDNITFTGDGAGSIIKTTNDKDTFVNVSTERDLTVTPAGAAVNNFTCRGISVLGTGHYTNYGLGFGRGILLRKVIGAIITNNYVFNMSMIGIVSENGAGYFSITNNIIGNCKYGSINYNGRCYQSIVSHNICYGSDADVNSAAIQCDGHCLISANTVFGSLTNYANAGGILWGEGAYYGVGTIEGNLIKHCRFGVKTIYHGPCSIKGNVIINCLTTGGINLVGGTSGGFTVESQDNLVANNFILNCSPYNIDCSAPNTVIQGNKGVYQVTITNPSASTEPDYIVATGAPQADIRVTGASCSINFNTGRACTRGIIVGETAWASLRNMQGNEETNTTAGILAIESASTPGTMIALTNLIERKSAGGGVYYNETFGNTKPSQGLWGSGGQWNRKPAIVGSSLGETVTAIVDTTAAGTASAGATTLDVSATVSAASLNTIGIQLDNGAWHWTTVTAYSAPTMTFSAAIPASRSVAIGARVYQNQWRVLGNLT